MRSHRSRFTWYAYVFGLMAAFGLAADAGVAGLTLHYTLDVRPGASFIPVELRIDGITTPSLILQLTENYAGIDGYAASIQIDAASAKPEPVDRESIRIAATNGSLVLRYRVDLRSQGTEEDRGRTLPVVSEEHAFIPGASTFVFPAVPEDMRRRSGIESVHVEFRKPHNWSIATSWGRSAASYSFAGGAINDLIYSFAALGDYRVHDHVFDGKAVTMAIRGSGRTSDREVADAVVRILGTHRSTFGSTPFARLLVIADFSRAGTASGNAGHNAINLRLPGDRSLAESIPFRSVIAHEAFHLWSGGDGLLAYGAYDALWLSEGVTDYYALKNLRRARLIQEAEFMEEVASKLLRLDSSFVRDRDMIAAGNLYFEDSRYRNLVYTKGTVAGFVLDEWIRATVEGRSLDDVLRRLAARRNNFTRGERYVHADFVDALREVAGRSAVEMLERLAVDGYRTAFHEGIARAGLTLERKEESGFTAGIFDIGPARDRPILRSLDLDGPAYAAGIRDGDEVVAVAGTGIGSRAELEAALRRISQGTGDPVVIRVQRSGTVADFRVRPEPFRRYILKRSGQ